MAWIYIGTTTMENIVEVPSKTKNRTTAIQLSHSWTWSRKDNNSKRYMHLNVHSDTIYSSQDMEETKIFTNRGMNKEHVVHMYKGMLLSHKTKWNNAICSHRDGLGDDHTKWNQRKINIIYHLCVESKSKWYKWTYLQNRNKLRNIENKLMITKGQR